MKYPLLLSLLCCMTAGRAAQPVKTLRCDFSYGIPAGFTLIDNDRNTPSPDNTRYPFAVGTPWLAYFDSDEGNMVAVSTSWYDKEGTSDDWMILPEIDVEADNALLSWRARATDSNFRDGYSVYVSTSGNDISNFDQSAPLFTVKEESAEWTRHSVSLAAYKGKKVRIAFVNNSSDCSCLYIDDIVAGTPSAVGVRSTTSRVVKSADKIAVSGEVFTDLDAPLHGIDVSYTYAGKTVSKSFPDADVAPGKPFAFAFEPDFSIGDSQDTTFCLSASHNGAADSTTVQLLRRKNMMVAEELTGTWCGYCVKGTVALKKTKSLYPDSFIGIAVHGPSVSQDFLCIPEYASYINYTVMSGLTSYPISIINRNREYQNDPQYIPYYHDAVADADIRASVDLGVKDGDNGTVDATTRVVVNSGCDDGRYRLSYVVLENDVYEPGDKRYRQHNSYAGGASGEMDGYENLPEWIYDYHFNDVARSVIGDYQGIEGSMPQYVVAGHEYTDSREITLPESVLNRDNVEIVALLLDTHTGEIVNACKKPLGNGATGIWSPKAGQLPTDKTEYYTIDGRRLPTAPNHGIVITRGADGSRTKICCK